MISDLHCGHRGGLTPPGQYRYNQWDDENVKGKYGKLQATVWDWYAETVGAIGPVDLLVVNGDAIDGKGVSTGGSELLTADRLEQCEIAAECINIVDTKKTLLIRGTPYHVGKEEDWEDVLGAMIRACDVGAHEWVEADGVIIDFKHKVGSSAVPHGRATALLRSGFWGALWAERGLQPRADILIRSHVHYHVHVGNPDRLIMTTPCLQAWSKYGTTQCEGLIDLGFITIECDEGEYRWRPHLLKLDFMKAQPLKL